MYCVVTTYWVPLDVVEVDEPHGDVLAVGAERHRPLAGEPRRELLVRFHQPVRPYPHQDGPQPVEHVVGAVGLCRDLRVEADQRVAHVFLDEHLVGLPRELLRPEVVPAEARQRAVPAGEAGAGRGVVGDASAQDVADERFDRVGFSERHAWSYLFRYSATASRTLLADRSRAALKGSFTCRFLITSPRSGCGYKPIGIHIEKQNAPPPSPDHLLS